MVEIGFNPGPLPETGTVVVLVAAPSRLGTAARDFDAATGGQLARLLAAEDKPPEHGRVLHLPLPHGTGLAGIVLLVLGKPAGVTALDLEEAGGALVARLAGLRIAEAAVAAADGLDLGHDAATIAARLAHGAALRGYDFTKYKQRTEPDDERDGAARRLVFHGLAGEAPEALRARQLAAAVHAARDLVSEPANVLTPRAFAETCRDLAELGVEVEVIDRAELERLGMRALLGVAQGSVQPPYVAVMRWKGAEQPKPLALVGKGVCFDSGGLSIKPAGGMEEMKWDMGGAAAVYGAIRALALRRAAVDVVGLVGLVENMPSGSAQRPGDVVRAMSGTTIEVVNTDAEGRLVLADVLWYAKERFQPVAMIDLATLTGAIVVALGHEHAGLFASDEDLAMALLAAGEATGERLWRMPVGKAYAKHIRSDVADIKNVGRAREAGASAGAVFLQRFVGDVPWAHIDIAGTAWTSRAQPLAGKGATGFGVRLLDRLVADRYEATAAA
jgi:leucyl aminopeptidase